MFSAKIQQKLRSWAHTTTGKEHVANPGIPSLTALSAYCTAHRMIEQYVTQLFLGCRLM